MAIVIEQSKQNNSSTTSVSATFVSSPTQNNLLYAAVYSSATTPDISGWTSINSEAVANGKVIAFYKIAGSGESSTVTATDAGATAMRIAIIECSGVGITSP